MTKILKNGGLDQYDPERFDRLILLQSEKCGTERVNVIELSSRSERLLMNDADHYDRCHMDDARLSGIFCRHRCSAVSCFYQCI